MKAHKISRFKPERVYKLIQMKCMGRYKKNKEEM